MTVDWKLAAAAAVGGALGSLARDMGSLATAPISEVLPWGTILINIAGSFVIGATASATAGGRLGVPEIWRVFVMVGLCGGFTTFSAFSLQTFDLLREGAMVRAGLNVALSVALCLAGTAAGYAAVRALARI